MEDKVFRKGLSVAAIVLIAISAVLLSLNDTNALLFGKESSLYGFFFIAAFAIPLLAILIVLTRYYKSTDTMEEMIGAIAVRYSIFGWIFVFVMRLATSLFIFFNYDFYSEHLSAITLIVNSINVCVVGTIFVAIALRGLPVVKIEKRTLKFKQLLLLIMMMYGISQVGAMMGAPIESILSIPGAVTSSSEEILKNLQNNLMLSPDIAVRIITIGILPAVFEELLFRKFMIDRTIRHGEFVSCAMSGIMFGLWHGNFQQFFFTFFIGVLFAFVYIRTGNIIYTMILHASMNLVSTTVTVELVSKLLKGMGFYSENGIMNSNVDYDTVMHTVVPILLVLIVWMIMLSGFEIAGFILFIVKRKNFKLVTIEGEPVRKEIIHKMTHSVAMWIFFAFGLLRFICYYFPDILASFFR